MPTSHHEVISKVLDLVVQIQPTSVLDIGVGFGKMGVLCREYLDIWQRRIKPEDWQIQIDGLEIFQDYKNSIHESCYNTIYYENVMDRLDLVGQYDLVLMLDVIEHLTKDNAAMVLEAINGAYIISTPQEFHSYDSGVGGNDYERHISRWYPSEFKNVILMDQQIVAWELKENNEMNTWGVAQANEKGWWGGCLNTYYEEEKQLMYADKMALQLVGTNKTPYTFDMDGKSVLDIGGGPASILLKCQNVNGVVIDPLEFPAWVQARYQEAGIEYRCGKGEDIDVANFDEVWIYNVLQHVDDPEKVIRNAKKAGKLIRIFEWVDTLPDASHPNKLDANELDQWLGGKGAVEDTEGSASLARVYYGVFEEEPSGPLVFDEPSKLFQVEPDKLLKITANDRVEIGENTGTNSGVGFRGSLEGEILTLRHKRFHLLALPHVAANKNELCCAFSQKVVKMGKMLKSMGHTVYCYGVEGSDVECDEFVPVSTQAIIDDSYGIYDTTKETYRHDVKSNATKVFNENSIVEIRKRMQSNDFLLIPFSPATYKPLIDNLRTNVIDSKDKLKLIVEMGIGYRGTYCPYRVFESVSQQHLNYGIAGQVDGSHYDVVIPNYFDPADFTYSEEKDDYFLFLGRVVIRKGVATAVETTRMIGSKLIVAGQQAGENVDLSPPHVEYVGFADVEKRRQLLSRAKCLILPTTYIEPFGGVIIEAALSGTPVITTNWGAFPELVKHGKTGYRCQTLDQFVWAAKNIDTIKPKVCYDYGINNFSLERVKLMYEEYWDMLLDLKENSDKKGWSRIHPERQNLDWLVQYV